MIRIRWKALLAQLFVAVAWPCLVGCGGKAMPGAGTTIKGENPETQCSERGETIRYLKERIVAYGYSASRSYAYVRQRYVKGLVFLKSPTFDKRDMPLLLTVQLFDRRQTKVPIQYIDMTWLDDANAIPPFEVIGKGGRVVGVFEGIADFPEPIGGYPETWVRSFTFRPILPGEDESANLAIGSIYPPLHLDISSLREIDGVRFLHNKEFVGVYMAYGVGQDDAEIERAKQKKRKKDAIFPSEIYPGLITPPPSRGQQVGRVRRSGPADDKPADGKSTGQPEPGE